VYSASIDAVIGKSLKEFVNVPSFCGSSAEEVKRDVARALPMSLLVFLSIVPLYVWPAFIAIHSMRVVRRALGVFDAT
jgi:hypothetical protein